MSSPYPEAGYPAQVQLSPMQAPGVQAMSLDAVPGVVVRQATQVSPQRLCLPVQAVN